MRKLLMILLLILLPLSWPVSSFADPVAPRTVSATISISLRLAPSPEVQQNLIKRCVESQANLQAPAQGCHIQGVNYTAQVETRHQVRMIAI